MSNIDTSFQCIKVRWDRTGGEKLFESAKEYAFIRLETMSGKVHIV